MTGSEFASDYNKSNVLYEQQKSYITVFWNSDSYYPPSRYFICSKSTIETLKTLEQDVKCVGS